MRLAGYLYMYRHTHIDTYIRSLTHASSGVFVYVSIHIHISTHTCIHDHTHRHTLTHASSGVFAVWALGITVDSLLRSQWWAGRAGGDLGIRLAGFGNLLARFGHVLACFWGQNLAFLCGIQRKNAVTSLWGRGAIVRYSLTVFCVLSGFSRFNPS